MYRAQILAFVVACTLVSLPAAAQGNRGNSNGVPGSVANLQASLDALMAQIAGLPLGQLAALQSDVALLKTSVAALSERIDGLVSQLDARDAAVDAELDDVRTSLQELEEAISHLGDGGSTPAAPVLWSGGCGTVPAAGADDYIQYCADGSDASVTNVSGQFTVDANGTVTAAQDGLYRISFWALSQSVIDNPQIRVNGKVLAEGWLQPLTVLPGFTPLAGRSNVVSVVWRLAVGDTAGVWVYDNGVVPFYEWRANSDPAELPGSRLQVEYLGN